MNINDEPMHIRHYNTCRHDDMIFCLAPKDLAASYLLITITCKNSFSINTAQFNGHRLNNHSGVNYQFVEEGKILI